MLARFLTGQVLSVAAVRDGDVLRRAARALAMLHAAGAGHVFPPFARSPIITSWPRLARYLCRRKCR